jgi:hypothetical protein
LASDGSRSDRSQQDIATQLWHRGSSDDGSFPQMLMKSPLSRHGQAHGTSKVANGNICTESKFDSSIRSLSTVDKCFEVTLSTSVSRQRYSNQRGQVHTYLQ